MVVRDLLGILRRAPIQLIPSTSTRPALSPPPPEIPSVIYQTPFEWFLQLFAQDYRSSNNQNTNTPADYNLAAAADCQSECSN